MKFQIAIDPKQHDTFVSTHPLNNLLQSSTWAKVKDNWDSELIGVTDDEGGLLASSLVLIKHLPLGFTMLYIPRGPILDYQNTELLNFYFMELKKWAKTKRALFIKFDPNVLYESSKFDTEVQQNPDAKQIIENIKITGATHVGFTMHIKESIQPRIQANEPLSMTTKENYPKHTRRLIKDAISRGVAPIRIDEKGLKEFSRLIDLTEGRKGIALRNFDYFQRLMKLYGKEAYLHLAQINISAKKEELAKSLLTVEKELSATPEEQKKRLTRLNDQKRSIQKYLKELEVFNDDKEITYIAGILSIKFGNTLEMLYAGMDERFKKFYPQYVLYTKAFEDAYSDGAQWANMGGIEGTLDDGLSKFKSNFNPDVQRLIGEFTLPINKVFAGLGLWAYNKRKTSND